MRFFRTYLVTGGTEVLRRRNLWVAASNVVALTVELEPRVMGTPWLVLAQVRDAVATTTEEAGRRTGIVLAGFAQEHTACEWVNDVLEELAQ